MAIITDADLKAHLGITDTVDATTITSAVNAANVAVTQHCGRSFEKITVNSETERVFDARTPFLAVVDDFYDLQHLAVKTDDPNLGSYPSVWTITTDFIVKPLNGLVAGQAIPYNQIVATGTRRFPTGVRPGVQVTAAWGWTGIPAAVFEACLIKAARIFKRKDSPEGVVGGFSDFSTIRVSGREDPDVMALLGPFRRPEIVAFVA